MVYGRRLTTQFLGGYVARHSYQKEVHKKERLKPALFFILLVPVLLIPPYEDYIFVLRRGCGLQYY